MIPRQTKTFNIIRKNNLENIHIRAIEIGGTSFIDLRVFTLGRRGSGEPVPTKSGICIPRIKLSALIDALQTAERT